MDRVCLDHLLLMARRFQTLFDGHDLLKQMRATSPCGPYAGRWEKAIHRALTGRVYRTIIVARTRQKAPGQGAFDEAMLWFAAVWVVRGGVDFCYPQAAEQMTGWPAHIPHPFAVFAEAEIGWPRKPTRIISRSREAA